MPNARIIAEELGMVPVRHVDLAIGMGATFLDQAISETQRFMPREWLDLYTRSPADKLIVAQGAGDSMFPTIHHNDLVLIDTTQNIPQMSDQVFAVSYCGLGCVKRLRPTNDGGGSSSPITQPSPPSPPMTANSTFWAAWSRSSGRCDPRRGPDGSHRLPRELKTSIMDV
jgi:hypothetical protein